MPEPDLLGKTVRAKPGREIHAGEATGKVIASRDHEDPGAGAIWIVEWDNGPPWRGWYLAEELEVVDA